MNPPVALVTGGPGGLGSTICQHLARDHVVAAAELDADPARPETWHARRAAEPIRFIF